jgi:hypothetical protein
MIILAMPLSLPRVPLISPEMERARALVSVDRVGDPGAAAAIFRKKFGHPLPDFPDHYVATYRGGGAAEIVGYVHMTALDAMRLCGGLCVDDTVYRRMDAAALTLVRVAGGIGKMMVAAATADRGEALASFGYMGNRQSQLIAEDVGYELAIAPHVYAFWHEDPMPPEARERLLARVRELGPF